MAAKGRGRPPAARGMHWVGGYIADATLERYDNLHHNDHDDHNDHYRPTALT